MSSIVPSSRPHASAMSRAYIHDIEHYLSRVTGIVAHVVFFVVIIRFFVFEPGITDGASMAPTMRDNTYFLAEKISALATPLKRFDIVQHIEPIKKDRSFVKRIIGLPRETVTIKQNAVFITSPGKEGYELNEPYLRPDVIISVPFGAQREFVIGDNEYFVLGDNRQNSNDSRAYGPVHRSMITGKVFPLMLQ